MATFQCPDCKHKVSEKAQACPECGRVFTPEEIDQQMKLENKSGSIGCGIFIILIIIVFLFSNSGDSKKTTTSQVSTMEQPNIAVQTKKMIGLKMTPTQIANSINHYYKIAGFKPPLNKIEKFKSYDGAINDVYSGNFSNATGIQFVTPKNEKNVTSLNIISIPENKEDSLYLMFSIGTVIATLSPHLNKDERGKVLFELLDNKNGGLNENKSVIIKNIKYTFNSSKELGIMFFAENDDD